MGFAGGVCFRGLKLIRACRQSGVVLVRGRVFSYPQSGFVPIREGLWFDALGFVLGRTRLVARRLTA